MIIEDTPTVLLVVESREENAGDVIDNGKPSHILSGLSRGEIEFSLR